ncbi:MAG TPA: circularly permuted type 2 ATP-grasp protein [Blastocatellia bacterium]|nr:circularly permuted type 2 ATP-grasp protein [Blastocatellia bacterium]
MPSDPARDYNRLLERDSALLDRSREFLAERFREVRLIFGGRSLSPYLRPHFVHKEDWRRIAATCETIWGAIEKVGRIAQTVPGVMEQLGLTEAERKLAAIDPGYEEVSVSARLDSFLTGGQYQFVELNAECPAGIAYADAASQIFLELPVMREFARTHNVRPMYCRQSLLDSLLTVYAGIRGADRKPNIAIVDYRGLPTQREFELFKDFFESSGYPATIADPRDLEIRNGVLFHGDFKIDLVYRRLLVTEFLQKVDECQALLEAYSSGAVVMVNSFRTKYVHKKMLFGILTDERNSHYFSEAENDAIRRTIPWTRKVSDVATEHDGEPVQLLEFVRGNKDHLVLKPNDDYGGHGIYIGWDTEQGAWEQAIEKATNGDYLIQERVSTGKEIFPFVNQNDGSVQMVEQLLDIDPLLFFGKVAGAFTRLSSSSLANVSSGGGMVPTMIID